MMLNIHQGVLSITWSGSDAVDAISKFQNLNYNKYAIQKQPVYSLDTFPMFTKDIEQFSVFACIPHEI